MLIIDPAKRQKLELLYEIVMSILSLTVAVILIIQFTTTPSEQVTSLYDRIDKGILIAFAADYFIRLAISKDKLQFFKHNIIELIAIIPFNSLFQAIRLVRILRLTRLLRLTKAIRLLSFIVILYRKAEMFLKTNNFHYILCLTIITVIIGATCISFTENISFGNALWWSFVTTTTVGYGDISPTTLIGRIVAVTMMIIGISFLGMLTGTISTYFITSKVGKSSFKEDIVANIKAKLDDIDNLSDKDIDDIHKAIKSLKEK